MIIKHAQVVSAICSGEPFSALYCKKNGELVEYTNARKLVSDNPADADAGTGNTTGHAQPAGNPRSFISLLPIVTANGSRASLYTRLIIKFNGRDVVI